MFQGLYRGTYGVGIIPDPGGTGGTAFVEAGGKCDFNITDENRTDAETVRAYSKLSDYLIYR